MADVDQSFGVVRRGLMPAVPKPINLRSQKFENNELIPDVEIVPRGTCCWGSFGKFASANGSEKIDSVSLEGNESNAQNDLCLTGEEGLSTEEKDIVNAIERTISLALPSEHVANDVAGTHNLCPSDMIENGIDKTIIDSSAESDATSCPESVARPSSSESYSSSSATPIARANDQENACWFSKVYPEGDDKPSTIQVKQEIHLCNEPMKGSHDFGYFEGIYSAQSSFARPNVHYLNTDGTAGSHLEPPHHYSFLGVPYYDRARDKEIVVITMVGSPGVHGNYLPYAGFLDQCGRTGTYGSFPLQFGHFESCPRPQVSTERYSSKELEYMCYGQDKFNHGWVNGSSMVARQGSSVDFSTLHPLCEINPIADEHSITKRTGRQKTANRTHRASSKHYCPTAFVPERRVTLLTKESQHEVIISNVQKMNKCGNVWQANCTSSVQCSTKDVMDEVPAPQSAEGCEEFVSSGSPCDKAVVCVEASNDESTPRQSITSNSTLAEANIESVGLIVAEVADAAKSCASDPSENSLLREQYLSQAICKGSGGKNSSAESSCSKGGELPVPRHAMISMLSASVLSEEKEVLDQSPSPSPLTSQVPASSVDAAADFACIGRSKCEIRCLMKVGEIDIDCTWNKSTNSVALELAHEHVNGEENLAAPISSSLLNRNIDSKSKLAPQKSVRKWQPKGLTGGLKAGCNDSGRQVLDLESNEREFFDNQPNDISGVALHVACVTSPSSTSTANAKAAGSMSLSASNCKESGVSEGNSWTVAPLYGTQSHNSYTSKESVEGDLSGTTVSECTLGPSPVEGLNKLTITTAIGRVQTSQYRINPYTAGKLWRPKLSGVSGQENPALTISGAKTGKAAAAAAVCGFEANVTVDFKDCSDVLEVFGQDHMKDAHDKQPKVPNSNEVLQDVDHITTDDCKGGKSWRPSSQIVLPGEIWQGCEENKPVQKKSNDCLHAVLSHPDIRTKSSNLSEEYEVTQWKSSSPRNASLRNHGCVWRATGRQMHQLKGSPVSKPEEADESKSVVKRKEYIDFVQGASEQVWKRKLSCLSNK